MELIGSLFLTLAVALIVAIFVMQPFFKRQAAAAQDGDGAAKLRDHRRSALLAERDRVLTALQELDFDHVMGKVPESDYTEQRALMLHSGADVLRRLDAMNAVPVSELAVEERIEAVIAARRGDSAIAASPATAASSATAASPATAAPTNGGNAKDELEALIASRKRQRKESAAGFCPHCGRPVQKSDKFCSRCGTTQ